MQVATQPTASEFRGGIIGVALRAVSGADFVSPITDEHLLHKCKPCSQTFEFTQADAHKLKEVGRHEQPNHSLQCRLSRRLAP